MVLVMGEFIDLRLIKEIIENKFNKEKLVEILVQNPAIFNICIVPSNDKGMEALKILFQNGLKPHINEKHRDVKHFEIVMESAIVRGNIDAMRLLYDNYCYERNFVMFNFFLVGVERVSPPVRLAILVERAGLSAATERDVIASSESGRSKQSLRHVNQDGETIN